MRLKRKTLKGLISGIFATLILCVGVLHAYAEQMQADETVGGVDMVYLITDWVYTADMAQTALRKLQEHIIFLVIISESDVKKLDAILASQRAQETLSPVGGETYQTLKTSDLRGVSVRISGVVACAWQFSETIAIGYCRKMANLAL